VSRDVDYIAITRDFYESNAEAYAKNTSGMLDLEWLEKFSQALPDGGRVLDVGCASGRDTKWFADNGFDAHGVDLSPRLVSIAQDAVPNATIDEMNVMELQFPDEFFDGVWCSCVLLHISRADAPKAVKEMVRVLRREGLLYVLVKEGSREGIEEDSRYGGAEKFASYFTADELKVMMKTEGLAIVEFSGIDVAVDEYRAKDRLFALARKQ